MKNNLESIPAKIDDCSFILDQIINLATFEKAKNKVSLTIEDLERDGFGDRPLFFAELLYLNGIKAGFFLYYFRYSTWKGKSLYLEDLYVLPEYRRNGLAQTAFKKLSKIAHDQNCGRFEWQVLDWNLDAIKFYEKFGTDFDSEWINCRLEGKKIQNPLNTL